MCGYNGLPVLFLNRIIKLNNLKEIKKELKAYAEKKDLQYNETVYTFVIQAYRLSKALKLDRKVLMPFVFDAIYFASNMETKKTLRIKKYTEAEPNKFNYYTHLQLVITKFLFEHYEAPLLFVEQAFYNSLFWKLSCIQRDRRFKKEDK